MLSIEASLWPVMAWMRIFGFYMGSGKSNDSDRSVCLVATGAVMVLSTTVLHCASFVRGVFRLRANEVGPNGTNLTTANLINIGIEHLNYTCILIGVHAAFYIVSLSSSWRALWDGLLVIEHHLNFKLKFYRKCRKCVIVGFVLLFLDCATYVFMSINSKYWDLGTLKPLAIILSNVSRTIVLSVFLLFCVVARVMTLVFQGLNERIALLDEAEKFLPFYSNRVFNVRLEKWRKNHTLACELVDMVNRCFGLVLLLTITNGFLSFITTSFEIVRSMQENDTLPGLFVFIFVKKSILLTIMIYEPYRLQAEASRTAVSFRRLQPQADLLTQTKLNAVITEVTHASPKITAMEFFDVNLRLLPTLIGSTLTYVAILCQASTTYSSVALHK